MAAAGALLLVAACAGAASPADHEVGAAVGDDRLVAVATFSVIADFVAAVTGERSEVETIVPLGADPHTYEPVPSDVRLLAEADVVFDNGLGLSPWFEPLRAQARGPVVELTAELEGDALVAQDGAVDPHMWLSPALAARYVDVIADALAEQDPDSAARYTRNAARYRTRLEALDEELRGWLGTVPEEKRKLVTYEDAFNYFAAHYGFEVLATVVGPTTEEEPSAERIRWFIDRVREAGIPTVFVEELVDARVIERAATDAGVNLAPQELFVDSLGEPDSGAATYVDMMRLNVRTIVTGLGGRVDEG